MIAEDWRRLKNAYERNMMIKRAQTARIIVMCAYSAMTIAFVFVVVLPICGISIRYLTNATDPGKLLPLQTYYPYDVSKRPQYELTFFIQSIAIFFAIVSYTDVLPLLNMIKDDWLKPKMIKERDIMIKRARIARMFTIFGYIIMLISFTLYAVLPAFGISIRYVTNETDPNKLLPLQSYYIYDRDKSPYYEITYIMQSLGSSAAGFMYTTVDSFLGLLVFHVCGQLENLKNRITQLDKFQNFEKALSHSVEDHIRLIRFINMIDDIFTLMLLGALFYFGVIFAFQGFLLVTMVIQDRAISVLRLTYIILTSVNIVAHTCLYCIVGEILVTEVHVLPLLNMIKDDWLKPKMIKERHIMIKRARIARMFTIFGYIIMLISFNLCAVLPAFGISIRYMTNETDPGKIVPLQSYYIYDRDKSPYYEITYIVQSLGMSAAAFMYTTVDSFLGLLIFHVCGQLENLKIRITQLDKFQNFENALSHSVQDHIRLIRFINMIDEIFTLMLLGALFYFGVLFALHGFLLDLRSIVSLGMKNKKKQLWYYKWAIRLNRASLTLLGVWPKNDETKQKKIISNVCTIFILNTAICGCIIPTVHSLFKVWGDIMSMIDNLQYTLPLTIAIIKLCIVWLRKEDVLCLLNMIKNDWLKSKMAKERDIMIKRARTARIFTIFGFLIMLASFCLSVILPVFGISIRYITNETDPGKLMPLQSYYIYDQDKSPFYEITYIVQCLGMSMAVFMYTGVDSFLGLLVFHVCGQLENLKVRIIHLDQFQNFENALSHNVQDHIRLIRLRILLIFHIIFCLFYFQLN
ncbi:Putative odorant receptor 13a [Cyphomyrmex costatus]|uniref:Putative odorant receptor 13a n=1 Tax=Cyphomyrmex costatus TaxID=456900 RepID=A0A151IM40_9HYME|nr:Putative odorant receptor 13a [Cyphomyrmex costatus]